MRIAVSFLPLMLVLLMSTACSMSSVRLGGHSVEQVYDDREVVDLVNAAMAGHSEEVARLTAKGIDPNSVGSDGTTPLIWSIVARNAEGTEALLKGGANPNLAPEQFKGISPMALLSGGNSPQLLELLLRYKGDARVESEPDSRLKPLNRAAGEGRLQNMKLLVAAGADLNDHDAFGSTAAIAAAAMGHFDIVAWMLDNGYTYDLQDLAKSVEIRWVPADSEAQRWKDKVIEMLKARGVRFPAFVRKGVPN